MAWKVEKFIFEKVETIESRLNYLQDAGWEIYKIHFSKTPVAMVNEVTIVENKLR